MLSKFLCCFNRKPRHNIHSTIKQSDTQKAQEPCIRIACDTDDTNNTSLKSITLFDKDNKIEWKDTVPFIPPIEKGMVIKVYDGDTITIASKLPYFDSLLYRFSVRLNGIDCPEIKGKDEIEKKCAQIAKQELTNLIMHKVVTLKNVGTEKYGRILADVYLDDLHLNKYMLDKRLAVKYDGGTKISPSNWMNYYETGEL
jgi:endonuclease YncB( thermonuclease family)